MTQEPGWTFVSDKRAPIRNAINVTAASTPSIQSMTIYLAASKEIFGQQKNSSKYAGIRRAHGWEARLKMNAIKLDTACHETRDHSTGLWNSSHDNNGALTIYVGPAFKADVAFPGATCSMKISQALIS